MLQHCMPIGGIQICCTNSNFLVSYSRNIYWASTIYHTFGIPRWIRYIPCLLVEETHTEQLVIQLCYESSGEAIQENPWLPRVTMDSPILGRGRWWNTSWVLKDTLKVARWREWHETGTFLLPKVLWTEKWKPWQLSFMVLRHWVMARSDERRVVKRKQLLEGLVYHDMLKFFI